MFSKYFKPDSSGASEREPSDEQTRAGNPNSEPSPSEEARSAAGTAPQRDRSAGDPAAPPTTPANSDVEAARQAVRDVIAGRSSQLVVADSQDKAVRKAAAEELLAAMCGREEKPGATINPQELRGRESEQLSEQGPKPSTAEAHDAAGSMQDRREHARQLFREYGYLDEAIDTLRAAESPDERAAAARTLGIAGSQRETAPLIAALFDDSPEVRRVAGEALAQIGDLTVSFESMATLVNSGLDPGTPDVIQAIPAEPADTADVASAKSTTAETLITVQTPLVDSLVSASHPDEDAIANSLKDLERRMAETAATRKEVENIARLYAESEARFRAQVAARLREEEELRKKAEEEAARRRAEEKEKLQAEHAARVRAEGEAASLGEEEALLRIETFRLLQRADELAQRRAEIEEASRTARVADVERMRREAEERHLAELERLRSEEEALTRATQQAAQRRAEVEAARQSSAIQLQRLEEERAQLAATELARNVEAERMRHEAEDTRRATENRIRAEQAHLLLQVGELRRVAEEGASRRAAIEAARQNAEDDARTLLEAQQRMKAAEESRGQAEAERQRLEAEMSQRAEAEQRLLEDVRRRLNDQHQVLEDTARQRAKEEEQRLGQLQAFRKAMESSAQERAEKEQQLNGEVESLRLAEAEARKRIEEAEARRRSAESRLDLTTEKLQRLEAEAHARASEEERILARLEDVRRNVAVEVQAREEQEKRVREEIELLRRLEEEQRQLLAEQSRRRGESESRLQQEKGRYRIEEEARVRAEAALELLVEGERQAKDDEALAWHDDPAENLRPVRPSSTATSAAVQEEKARNAPGMTENRGSIPGPRMAGSDVSPIIVENLNSSDQFNRTAALAALARSGAKDAFRLIVNCFDDQSPPVRNAAARALSELEPHRPVEPFTRAIEEASPERRRNIGNAIASSGLAAEAIEALSGTSREYTYNALGLLFAMAKTGELRPLVQAVEAHQDVEVRRAAVKLLTLAGQLALAEEAAKRRLRGPGEGQK